MRIRPEALPPEAQKLAADFARRVDGFVFALSSWDAASLGWTLDAFARAGQS